MIHEYRYKPTPHFYKGRGNNSEDLFFGFELEVEVGKSQNRTKEELANDVRDLTPFCYCKRDGSIGCGFEIVSHPLSWKCLKSKAIQKKLAGVLDMLQKNQVESYDTTTCGLHVHVSKSALGNGVLESMLRFVFGNPDFIKTISRRTRETLDQWAKAHVQGREKDAAEDPDNDGKPRRLALNTLPEHTAEFRMFRGTLSFKGFMRAMEFCHSLVHAIKRKAGDITVDDFAQFIKDEESEYPNLTSFMARKRLGLAFGRRQTLGEVAAENPAAAAVAEAAASRLNEAVTRRRRALSAEDAARPTAAQLSEIILNRIYHARNAGMTWNNIEEEFALRRSNGMTALHAYQRAQRLGLVGYMVTANF